MRFNSRHGVKELDIQGENYKGFGMDENDSKEMAGFEANKSRLPVLLWWNRKIASHKEEPSELVDGYKSVYRMARQRS